MLRHFGLDEDDGLVRIDTDGQPVDEHIPDGLLHDAGVGVVRGQSMPVGGKEEAFVLFLQLQPVDQNALVMPQVQAAGWAHAGQDTLWFVCLLAGLFICCAHNFPFIQALRADDLAANDNKAVRAW